MPIKGMGLAVQLYSVRQAMAEDMAGTLGAIREMGYEGVEFAQLDELAQKNGLSFEDVKKILADLDLKAVSAHLRHGFILEDPARVLSAYAGLGCRYAAIPWLDTDCYPGAPKWPETKAAFERIIDEMAPYGMTLLYHNHDGEFTHKLDGQHVLDVMYAQIPLMQSEVDTCWARVAGVEPAAYVQKYTGRAPLVHLKDYYRDAEADGPMYELIGKDQPAGKTNRSGFSFKPLGSGVQDMPALVAAAKNAGAEWVVVESDSPPEGMTELQGVAQSAKYLLDNFA